MSNEPGTTADAGNAAGEIAGEITGPQQPHRPRRLLGWGLVLLAVLLMFFGRSAVGWWAQRTAASLLEIGAVSEAQRWLARAERFRPGDPDTRLLRARTHRHFGRYNSWNKTLDSLDPATTDRTAMELERRLGQLRWTPAAGEGAAVPASTLQTLTRAGVDRDEAATAVVFGLLAAGDEARVQRTLEALESGEHQPAQVAYLRGIYRQWKSDDPRAEEAFRAALASEPRHELARIGLAQVLENQDRVEPALAQFAELLERWPENEVARIGCSRLLRRLGRGEEAFRLMEQLQSIEEVSREVAIELAEIQYQRGKYEQAVHWFEHSQLVDSAHYLDTLRTAASAYALAGQATPSRSLFNSIYATQERTRRLNALQARVDADLSDTRAAAELQQVSSTPIVIEVQPEVAATDASALFARHCAACHGDEGDGHGRAASNLFPRPRNLRLDRYRLVSTTNLFPTQADILAVLRHGIPGTAMPSFAQLSDEQLRMLAERTHQIRREGLRTQLAEGLRQTGEDPDPEMVERLVHQRTAPGPALQAAVVAPVSPQDLIAGKALYHKLACSACHGPEGRGTASVATDSRAADKPANIGTGIVSFFDEEGLPSVPRDLVTEPFKGGDDPRALFARLRLGMPGTAHPGNPAPSDGELAQLVAYCLSLAAEPKPQSTNHQRAVRANRRALQSAAAALNAQNSR